MKEYITEKNFILAEKTAQIHNIHISEAISELSGDFGEIRIADVCKVMELVKPRPENSHKGSFGKLIIIAGSERYPGAPQISALAALRTGVGLCTVITTKTPAQALAVNAKEATLLQVSNDKNGFMDPDENETDSLLKIISSADAVLIGPGLGTQSGCLRILELAIKSAECPIILDADGINLVSGRIEFLRKAKAELILTPHPAELARLCSKPLSDIIENRIAFSKDICKKTGAVVVSKSAGTVIVSKNGLTLSARGNNGLSKGGSGDLLAGLIASFSAQGYQAEEASLIGVTLQGLGCELASKNLSRRGMLASDIISVLPLLFQKSERHDLIEKDCSDSLHNSHSPHGLHPHSDVGR